jgi:dTDP-4-amino-4,6-dideoxygalactose transaminase
MALYTDSFFTLAIIETTSAKSDQLESLINDRTVAILFTHLYGKWCNIDDIIDTARRKNIQVIEDCAESFCGFEKLGHPNNLTIYTQKCISIFSSNN